MRNDEGKLVVDAECALSGYSLSQKT